MINQPQAWEFTGKVYDYGEDPRQCALCHKKTRYGYQIKVRRNRDSRPALVGPECCSKVHIPDAHADNASSSDWLKANKARLELSARQRRLKKLLIQLAKSEPSYSYNTWHKAIDENKAFTPKSAALIVGLLKRNLIDFNRDLIRVDFRSTVAKEQIALMERWQVNQLKEATSDSQSAIVDDLLAG